MENEKISVSRTRFRCPECSNFINGTIQKNGNIVGQCPVCKSVISCKQCSSKEKHIKIINKYAF